MPAPGAIRKAGKTPTQAMTVIMRKIIVPANTLLKKDRKWQRRAA